MSDYPEMTPAEQQRVFDEVRAQVGRGAPLPDDCAGCRRRARCYFSPSGAKDPTTAPDRLAYCERCMARRASGLR